MMNCLTRYLGKTIIGSILLTMLLLLGLDLIFSLVNELRSLGQGDYDLLDVFLFLGLSIPQKIYLMFPMSALIGTLMGLGTLASHSELLVMRAQGLSIIDIIKIVLKTALLLSIIAWCLGEVVGPYADNYAQKKRTMALSGGKFVVTDEGTWMRDGNAFVYIESMTMGGHVDGLTRYQFDDNFKLQSASFAKYADYNNKKWILYEIKETIFESNKIKRIEYASQAWHSVLSPSILSVVGVKSLEKLSFLGLWKTIQYRVANDLDAREYQLVLWQKIMQPIVIMVMMFLAIPFIFGPLRSTSMGLRLLAGIGVGFSFFIINEVLGHVSLLYSLPVVLGAILPTLLVALLGGWLLREAV